jgi:hypothetical protein
VSSSHSSKSGVATSPLKVITQSKSFPKEDMELRLELPRNSHHSPSPLPLWIFESSFINGLPWDSGEWHLQASSQMGDFPFFDYSAKQGYRNARKPTLSINICSFIQRLNLQNSTVMQVIARIWHNFRPRKVGTLIWLTLNRGLSVGTLATMHGDPPHVQGLHRGGP